MCSAARHDQLETLKWLLYKGYSYNDDGKNNDLTREASQSGNINMIQFLLKNNIRFDKNYMMEMLTAAEHGDLNMFKFYDSKRKNKHYVTTLLKLSVKLQDCTNHILQNTDIRPHNIIKNTIANNDIKNLEIYHSYGFELKDSDCIYASSKNSLECLKYLYENGCMINNKVTENAFNKGNKDCFIYANSICAL
jgi:hypothetical protein